MKKEIYESYKEMAVFLSGYRLKNTLEDSTFTQSSKSLHKKLFSLLIFVGELDNENDDISVDALQMQYFKEIVSDLVLSFFCWTTCTYKPASLQLRSAIENFIRTMLFNSNPNVIAIKNVFQLFDDAKIDISFSSKPCSHSFDLLHQIYIDLCGFVHSSSDRHIQNISFSQVVAFDGTFSSEYIRNFETVLNNILAVLYFNYYGFIFENMHELNISLFLDGIPKSLKKTFYDAKMSEINNRPVR